MVESKRAKDANYKMVATDIQFDLEAIEDVDIYKFLYVLTYGFPGQVVVNDFTVSRDVEVTQPLLRRIGSGQSEPIVQSSVRISWYTMVPEDNDVTEENGGRYE